MDDQQSGGDTNPNDRESPYAPPPSEPCWPDPDPVRTDGDATGDNGDTGGNGGKDGDGGSDQPPPPRPPWRDFDPAPPSDELLQRHGALVLDPLTALRVPGLPLPRPTTYLAASLIVPFQLLGNGGLTYLMAALKAEQLTFDVAAVEEQARLLAEVPAAGTAVELLPAAGLTSDTPGAAPDAWAVLQRARAEAQAAGQLDLLAGLGLNHLLVAGSHVDGHPVEGMSHVDGHPVFDSAGLAEYVLAGSGGRAPVSWVGQPPNRQASVDGRRPVVAVLDTGCGNHPWLTSGVGRSAVYRGLPAEVAAIPDPEVTGDVVGPMDGALDSHSGHGTFIAGLVRQISPDSDILALRIMASDGIVQEGDLLQALSVLHGLAARGQTDDGDPFALDIVSLSLGYYHETPDDELLDPLLSQQIEALAAIGVCVVACAGNDATRRKMYPAAFAPRRHGHLLEVPDTTLPTLSVGALNPDGTTALFSNGGRWVLTWEVGAAVVSTFPTSFNGGAQPSVRVSTPYGRPRATIDPDSFASGFGTWSGTSFSTPILAARIAEQLQPLLGLTPATAPVARMWQAITAATGLRSQ
jgi:hypothetical protein